MEHHDHDNCPWRSVVRVPLVVKILTGILNVGMWCIEWIELTCEERGRKRRRRTDCGWGGNGRFAGNGSRGGLQLRECSLKCLRQCGTHIRRRSWCSLARWE